MTSITLSKQDFYYCYDWKVAKMLRNKGYTFLVHAYAGSSKKEFWLFQRTPDLEKLVINR